MRAGETGRVDRKEGDVVQGTFRGGLTVAAGSGRGPRREDENQGFKNRVSLRKEGDG